MLEKERVKILTQASWVGIVGNAILAVLKITVGFIASSLALMGDGIDSLTDILSSLIGLFAAKYISEPPDKEHPWGHGRAETLATKLLSFIIFFAGAQLFLSAIQRIITRENLQLPSPLALWITLVSIGGKLILALYKYAMGKKANSKLLIADAVNMRNDIFLSISVFLGIGLTLWLQIPLIDSIVSLGLSCFILYSAYSIFVEANSELMDSMEDSKIYEELFDSLKEIPGLYNPHRCRIRRINTHYDIDLDIEVDGKLSLEEAHDIAKQAEDAVKERLKDVYDIMIHVEPLGNIEHKEQFGLTPESWKEDGLK